ncbi:MAG: T9SS type A sorting domain-containing protein [bacterium]|nr:T9SS type A sorting domain-containing protein [bacterium]
MKSLLATIILLLGVVILPAAQVDTVKYTTRSNNGPEKDYVVTDGVRQFVDASGALRITAIYDSTAQGILYMELFIPGYTKTPVGSKSLSGSTTWKYGHNTGQVVICRSGAVVLQVVDGTNDRLRATFQWTGVANLPNGVILNSTISKGSFSLYKKPKLAHDIIPKSGVKWKPEEKVKFTVLAKKNGSQTPIADAKVKLVLPPAIFESGPTEITTDANGRAEWNFTLKKTAEGGDYKILVSSTKQDIEDSDVDTFAFKVEPTLRYYYAKCVGLPIMEFDAGEGKVWEDGGGSLIKAEGTVRINGFLIINGTVNIDTTGQMAKVTGTGSIATPTISFDGASKPFVFYDGPFALPPIACEAVVDLTTTAIVQQLAGNKLKEAKIRFLGDFVNSAGVSVSATLEGPRNMAEGCNDAVPFGTVWSPNKATAISIEISILKEGGEYNVTATGKASEVAIGASFCVKEFSISYDSKASEFTVSGKGKTPFFEEIAASITMKDGTLNKFSGSFKLDACIPIPETPACFKGGGMSVENLAIGNPFKAKINSIFQLIGKPDLVEMEFSGELISPPNSITAEGTLKLLNIKAVSADKPWQVVATDGWTFTIDDYSIADKGTLNAIHLGGDYFLYDATFTSTLGLKPTPYFSYVISGGLRFPVLPPDKTAALGMFGRFVNQCAPLDVGTAGATLMLAVDGEKSISANYDLRNLGGPCAPDALKKIGKASLYFDFNKLPSPSALTIDANMSNLLTGWGFGVQDVRPGKRDEQVQAATSTFVVGADEKILIAMSETVAPPAAITLRSPSGTTYTTEDPGNGVYRALSPDGKIVLWTIENPAAGTWTVEQPQGRTADSVMAAVSRIYPDLALTATQAGRVITVTWGSDSYPAGSRITILGDKNDSNTAGQILFEGPATTSPITITLTDTTAPCEFHINGRITGFGVSTVGAAAGTFSNPKDGLLPPQNAMAVTNQNGVTGVTWSPITNGIVGAVVVYRVDGGRMEVVTSAYNYETGFTFVMADPNGAILKVASVDKKGRMGCLSEAISVTTGIKELEHQGNGMTMWLAPNPASDQVSVRTDVAEGNVDIKLIDMMGRVVLTLNTQDSRSTLDLSSLSSGTYVLVAQVGEKHVASTLNIVR